VDSGFDHPSFDLLTINKAFVSAPFLAASAHNGTASSYATVACTGDITGFHSDVVSSGGLPKTVVPSRGVQVYERFIAAAARPDVAGAADIAFDLRRQLYGVPFATLTGRVDGATGSEQGPTLLVVEKRGEARIPWTQVVPAADGSFRAHVPAEGVLVLEVFQHGRKVNEVAVPGAAGDRDAGVVPMAPRTPVTVSVVDENDVRIDAQLFVIPADDATRKAAEGKLYGQSYLCSPWLGPPMGGSPACDRVLQSQSGPVTFTLPPGRFHIYGWHGPFHALQRATIDTAAGAPAPITLRLTALPLRPVDTLSSDLHVHGASSFDSSMPDQDRVLAFAAADVDVIVASDHDVVGNYDATIDLLGLQNRVTAISAVETTGHVPWLKVPGDSFPRVVGHYNFWPLAYRPGTPRNGGPFDEFIEPGELFARTEPLYTGEPVRQLNHPWAASEFGRDLGFPRAIHLDLRVPLPASDDGTNAGIYVRRHGAFGNGDHDSQEVMNGSQNDLFLAYRAFWFYLLDQGIVKVGTANSDSHSLTDNTIGTPRTIVYTQTRAGTAFDVGAFNRALKAGRAFGTNGPIIDAVLQDDAGNHDFGSAPIRPGANARLRIVVSAAPWVAVEEVRVIVNGQVVRTIAANPQPDPFGTTGLLRVDATVPLADVLTGSGDAWIVIEAGHKLPLAGDLGGGLTDGPDGVPDTTDNNGDGVVDQADVAEGSDYGPLKGAPEPPRDDPRWHFFQLNGGHPLAFTNPFLIDRNGNGRFDGAGK
jgi:hypothetical protein